MATGFHGFHVIIGMILLTVWLHRAFAGQFSKKQHLGVRIQGLGLAFHRCSLIVSVMLHLRTGFLGGRDRALIAFGATGRRAARMPPFLLVCSWCFDFAENADKENG
jgi:hypothetical protein